MPQDSVILSGYSKATNAAVLCGTTDADEIIPLAFTGEGHAEVAIHGPLGPFGSLHTENWRPLVAVDAVYGPSPVETRTTITGTGSVTGTSNLFTCSTGTTIYSSGTFQTRRRARYRPGQGIIALFTAKFPASVASSVLVAGIGNAESGVYVGYNGTTFGALHVTGGVREIRTLTISTKSSTAENAVVTLNDVAFNIAVTNGASTITTAYELSKGTYAGWTAESIGSTVVFVSNSAGAKAGAFSVAGTTVVGSFARTLAGVASTDTWVAQTAWNGDKLDGTGASGVTLDPTKLNIFKLGVQYLGAGAVTLECEVIGVEGNNATYTLCHTFNFPNSRTAVTFSQPSFPFTMSAYSAGSTTDVSIQSSSVAIFLEGLRILSGPRFTARNFLTTVGPTNLQALFTIKNNLTFAGRANQVVANIISMTGAAKHTSPTEYYIVRNATLAGSPNFVNISTSSSCSVDTAATTATYSDGNQLVFVDSVGDASNIDITFADDIQLQPGETMSLCARATTGTPSYVTGAINWREDQ